MRQSRTSQDRLLDGLRVSSPPSCVLGIRKLLSHSHAEVKATERTASPSLRVGHVPRSKKVKQLYVARPPILSPFSWVSNFCQEDPDARACHADKEVRILSHRVSPEKERGRLQKSAPDFPLAQPDEETPKTQRNRVTMCGQDTQTRPRRPTAGNARHSPKAELTTPSIGS